MSSLAVPVAALAFASWAVYLGGLASLQSHCETGNPSTYALLSALPCSKVYRFYWFIMSWELVVVLGLIYAAVTGKLASMKTSFIGLFAVGTLLYIDAANMFLTTQSDSDFESDTPLHRIRTITAGSIMTALMNAIAIIALGLGDAPAAPAAAEEKTAV